MWHKTSIKLTLKFGKKKCERNVNHTRLQNLCDFLTVCDLVIIGFQIVFVVCHHMIKSLLKEIENLLLLSHGIGLALCSVSRWNLICMLKRNKLLKDVCMHYIHIYLQCQETWKKYAMPERGISHKFRLCLLIRSVASKLQRGLAFVHYFLICVCRPLYGLWAMLHLSSCVHVSKSSAGSVQIYFQNLCTYFFWTCAFLLYLLLEESKTENKMNGCFRSTCGFLGML